ncbi:MAG: hypothetical protein ACQXXL_00430 [Candidatus Methanosuratincola sp.]|jgi:hypothetical protein|nr:hypothetical protein [Candidatus Methanosuratincola sp.]
MKVESIILVTADWEKAGQYAMKVCDAVSKAQNVPLEIKKEDYDFLIAHGVKDEFGGIDIPQVFLKLEDGTVKYVMSRIPDRSDGMPDIEKGIQLLTDAIKAQ